MRLMQPYVRKSRVLLEGGQGAIAVVSLDESCVLWAVAMVCFAASSRAFFACRFDRGASDFLLPLPSFVGGFSPSPVTTLAGGSPPWTTLMTPLQLILLMSAMSTMARASFSTASRPLSLFMPHTAAQLTRSMGALTPTAVFASELMTIPFPPVARISWVALLMRFLLDAASLPKIPAA